MIYNRGIEEEGWVDSKQEYSTGKEMKRKGKESRVGIRRGRGERK